MPHKNKLELEILSIRPVDDLVMIVGKLVTGDVYGMGAKIPNFRCIETNGQWKLAAIGFSTPKGEKEGIRLIGFEHVEGNKDLEAGFTLVSEEV